jgi:hypothetical protein
MSACLIVVKTSALQLLAHGFPQSKLVPTLGVSLARAFLQHVDVHARTAGLKRCTAWNTEVDHETG